MVQSSTESIEMVTIPRQIYESLLETLETLSDKSELESIKRGIEDIKNKRTYTEKEFLKMYKNLLA
jgi:PHD/YefM family antitoxin component YafN of YafNO toxin-antitoxin module